MNQPAESVDSIFTRARAKIEAELDGLTTNQARMKLFDLLSHCHRQKTTKKRAIEEAIRDREVALFPLYKPTGFSYN